MYVNQVDVHLLCALGSEPVPESEEDVLAELVDYINESIAVTSYASSGLYAVRREVEVDPPPTEDFICFVGHGDPNDPRTRPLAFWRYSELMQQLALDGPATHELHRQWVVSLFAAWDEHFRPRLARARGVHVSDVVVPAFGDLRLFRHDIVHNNRLASSRNSCRAQTLRWFNEGDEIAVTWEHVLAFLDALPWLVMPYTL